MKQKELIYLLLAVTILLVAGYVGYTQFAPKKGATKTVEVEKIGSIPGELDAAALVQLSDPVKVKDFNSAVDLTNLNNRAVFGP